MTDRLDGGKGEDAAARHLEDHGYAILERNFKALDDYGRPLCEVDIIARRDSVLAFVEVRSRATTLFGDPEETVTDGKRRRVVRAALFYLTRHQIHDEAVRFDVISLVGAEPNQHVQHLEDAFDAGF